MTPLGKRRRRATARRNRRRSLLVGSVVGAAGEGALTWLRSGRPGGNLVVRCREGHLFTTIWLPAASLKSLRLGFWRIQYCPVGRHWTVVAPVRESELSEEDLRAAREHHDIRIP